MASASAIREGIATNLSALPGVQVSAYVLDNPTPPTLYVALGPAEYDETMGRGHDDWLFVVYGLIGYVTDVGAQVVLDSMLDSHGAASIKTLIETDGTLGGAADSLRVISHTGVRIYNNAGALIGSTAAPMIGAEWMVRVIASGNH